MPSVFCLEAWRQQKTLAGVVRNRSPTSDLQCHICLVEGSCQLQASSWGRAPDAVSMGMRYAEVACTSSPRCGTEEVVKAIISLEIPPILSPREVPRESLDARLSMPSDAPWRVPLRCPLRAGNSVELGSPWLGVGPLRALENTRPCSALGLSALFTERASFPRWSTDRRAVEAGPDCPPLPLSWLVAWLPGMGV